MEILEGDYVADMHDGPKPYGLLSQDWECESVHQIRMDGSTKVVQEILESMGVDRLYSNKNAIAVEVHHRYVIAIYSYDDRYFGTLKYRRKS